MSWVDSGQPEPSYLNPYRGQETPAEYIPLATSNTTVFGYYLLYPENATPPENITADAQGMAFSTADAKYFLPDAVRGRKSGICPVLRPDYPWRLITKGDNNPVSDEGYLTVNNNQTIEPVEKQWVVGKALFTIPLVGLLPLNIWWVIIVVIVAMVAWDWDAKEGSGHRQENGKVKAPKKGSRKNK